MKGERRKRRLIKTRRGDLSSVCNSRCFFFSFLSPHLDVVEHPGSDDARVKGISKLVRAHSVGGGGGGVCAPPLLLLLLRRRRRRWRKRRGKRARRVRCRSCRRGWCPSPPVLPQNGRRLLCVTVSLAAAAAPGAAVARARRREAGHDGIWKRKRKVFFRVCFVSFCFLQFFSLSTRALWAPSQTFRRAPPSISLSSRARRGGRSISPNRSRQKKKCQKPSRTLRARSRATTARVGGWGPAC